MFLVSDEDSAVALDKGAAAILVRFRLIKGRGTRRYRPIRHLHAFASAICRLGEVRHAADIPEGIAGNKSKSTAFATDAEIPALLRKGAMEAPGGHMDFTCKGLRFSRE